MRRRAFLLGSGALIAAPQAVARAERVVYPTVTPGHGIEFPRDHGAHPEYRIEWWYVTGWLDVPAGVPLGFQITFFRGRPDFETVNPSRFALRQAIFAHVALADPRVGRLMQDQRAARAALGLAGAVQGRTGVWVDDWRFEQVARGYRANIAAREFRLHLDIDSEGAILRHGEAGVSRKGTRAGEASFYYSRPQLTVRGVLERGAARTEVSGSGWLDHEWSSAYLAPEAVGWDWVGINLQDGGALMAFRMRARDGSAHYAGGTLRAADGRVRTFAASEVAFEPIVRWRSPRTGVEYPIGMRIVAGDTAWRVEPLMRDQELDSRATTGTIYWEGAVRAVRDDGAHAGRGYLELTGYWQPMRL